MLKLFSGLLLLCVSVVVNATQWPWEQLTANADLPTWAQKPLSLGRVWHVDASYKGTQSSGSELSPFTTIKSALSKAKASDEIWVYPGEYQEAIVLSAPITLRSVELHQAKIIRPNNDKKIKFALRFNPSASGAKVIGFDIQGGYYYTVVFRQKYQGLVGSGVHHVLLSQNKLHGSGRDVVKLNPYVSDIVIERNDIYNSGVRDDSNAEGIDAVNVANLIIQDNYIHDTATTGVYVKGGSENALIQRNLIKVTGLGGILVGFDTSPQFFNLQSNPKMFEALNTRVFNNIVDGTQGAGIGVYAAKNTIIAHNTVLNSAKRYHSALFFGITLQDYSAEGLRPASEQVSVYNNIFHSAHSQQRSIELRYLEDSRVGTVSALHGWPVAYKNVYAGKVSFSDQRPNKHLNTARLLQWQRHCSCDNGSVNAPLELNNQDYSPAALFPFVGELDTDELVTLDFYGLPRFEQTSPGAVAYILK